MDKSLVETKSLEESLEREEFRWQEYDQLCRLLLVSQRSSMTYSEKAEIVNTIASLVAAIFKGESRHLPSIWSSIIEAEGRDQLMQQFLSSYRLLSNHLRTCPSFSLTSKQFYTRLVPAIPFSSLPWLMAKYPRLSRDTQQAIVHWCDDDVKVADVLVNAIAGYECLELCRSLARSYSRADHHNQLLSKLIHQCLRTGIEHLLIIEDLILKKQSSFMSSRFIISTIFSYTGPNELSKEQLVVDIIDTVCRVWGSSIFLTRSDYEMQVYLTDAMLATMIYASAELMQKSSSSSEKIPIMVLLTSAISNYLDLTDKRVRILGMRVAKVYAKVMGRELDFEELVEEAADDDKLVISSAVSLTERSQVAEDSDDEDELPAYKIPDTSFQQKSTPYLHLCLEMLQRADTTADVYESHQTALASIPKIVATHPANGKDLAIPLMKELLRLPNTFNMENFDSLRSDAINSLLMSYPAQTMPIAVWSSIHPTSLPLGHRLSILTIIETAIYNLADIPQPYVTEKAALASVDAQTTVPTASLAASDPKTRIKRPRKLALMQQKTLYYRNLFAPVANIIYFPTTQALGHIFASLSSSADNSSSDSFDMMLAIKYFRIIASCTRCSYNTSYQQSFLQSSLTLGLKLRDTPILSIRRGALDVLVACMELWSHLDHSAMSLSSSTSQPSIDSSDALGKLLTIHNTSEMQAMEQSQVNQLILSLIDWAADRMLAEPDDVCRASKYELLRYGVQAVER
jgi:hypothetical protein